MKSNQLPSDNQPELPGIPPPAPAAGQPDPQVTHPYGPDTVPAEFTGIRPARWLTSRRGADGQRYLEFLPPGEQRVREPVRLMPAAEIAALWALLLAAGFLIEFVRQAVTR